MNNVLLNTANQVLTQKELSIFKLMLPKSGVPFLKGRPGIGKSAIINSIAKKLNFQHIDIRLSQVDETDLGLFPTTKTDAQGNTYVEYAIPHWAILSNEMPTIIHFEELNRVSLPIRNAALQILNERGIGYKFKFNENVYMVASGNLGEQDGTEVEEFDNALKTRLLTKKYDITLQEWIDGFAAENVNKYIVNYLNSKPAEFYKFVEGEDTYATPRGWTFLSNYITTVCDENNARNILDEIYDKAQMYIGSSATGFLRFLEDSSLISIDDILHRYEEVKATLKKLGMVKRTELLEDLKSKDFKFSENELSNIMKFLDSVEQDQLSGYLIHLLDSNTQEQIMKNESLMILFKKYKEVLQKIKK